MAQSMTALADSQQHIDRRLTNAIERLGEQFSRQIEKLSSRVEPDQKATWTIVLGSMSVLFILMQLFISSTNANVKTLDEYSKDSRELIREQQRAHIELVAQYQREAGRMETDIERLMVAEGERRREERAQNHRIIGAVQERAAINGFSRSDGERLRQNILELTRQMGKLEGQVNEQKH